MMENDTMLDSVNGALIHADEYIRKEYLNVLQTAEPQSILAFSKKVGTNVRLMHLKSFSVDTDDNIAQKICSIYGALELHGTSAALILDGRSTHISLYLGVFTAADGNAASSFRTFQNAFQGVFPGCVFENVKSEKCQNLLTELLSPSDPIAVSAVSAFPSVNRKENVQSAAGLEVLIDGMRGKPFSMILLAESVPREELVFMRQGYESLWTQIAPLKKVDCTNSTSISDTFGDNFSKSVSQSLSYTTGNSKNYSHSEGESHAEQKVLEDKGRQKLQASTQLLGAGASLLIGAATGGAGAAAVAGTANLMQNLFYGSAMANIMNSASALTGIAPESQQGSVADTTQVNDTVSNGTQENHTVGGGSTVTEGSSHNWGNTTGKTVQMAYENKAIADMLEQLENQIQETSFLEQEGAFRTAAYFIAGNAETAACAASLYRSVVNAGNNIRMSSPVYRWNSKESVRRITAALLRGQHPEFVFQEHPDYPAAMAAQPIALRDIPAYFCLPKNSVIGLNVTEHAAFARDILKQSNSTGIAAENRIEIGNIYHMGKRISDAPVEMNVDALCAHLFVAGTTGVGKSNFCYQLISKLRQRGVKALIIEPAKGEYAKVFGGKDFRVYGTNLLKAPPLRINPFAFPEGISTEEHIERLLAIFNAAWPMYSAMPALLKESIIEAYRRNGFYDMWDGKPEGCRFPCFQDLLDILPEQIKESQYSQEVQGNYIGALVTRVKSLTTGIYSVVFSEAELGDQVLFDEDVIIDISRVGSEETKALIMGILIARQSEYLSCSGRMNSSLNHITLLEEAHHLLGRAPNVQGDGAGNIRAASLEMINDAIREMRTYGNGFLIADQSPKAVDASVIANTQTKVFFMLPDREDRRIAGESIALSEKQIVELSKLPCGVAAIMQNGWTDAALCNIDLFPTSNMCPYQYNASSVKQETRRMLTQAAAILVRAFMPKNQKSSVNCSYLENGWGDGYGLAERRAVVAEIFEYGLQNKSFSKEQMFTYLNAILDIQSMLIRIQKFDAVKDWGTALEQMILSRVSLTDGEVYYLICSVLSFLGSRNSSYKQLYIAYLSYKNDTDCVRNSLSI